MSARRLAPSIPTASMSDIAFLLLVFFLVATAIRDDAGVPMVLPPTSLDHGPALEFVEVQVAASGQVLVDGDVLAPEAVRPRVAALAGGDAVPRMALQAHRETPYDAYIAALDAVLMGHRDADVTPRLALRDPVE